MTKKIIAQDFLTLCAKGESRQAFELYVANNFKHHNAYFKGDRKSLMIAIEESAVSSPNKVFEIQRILEDGNLVAVHSKVQLEKEEITLAIMHIMQFEGDKILELWDFGQAVPEILVNENGMF
jgi:predicted SnoaL-like aldol condensation-catalyzing enzyme|nr:nuclear transport factor 2 family protein [uncultured Flavobacterium sp.]